LPRRPLPRAPRPSRRQDRVGAELAFVRRSVGGDHRLVDAGWSARLADDELGQIVVHMADGLQHALAR